MSKTIKKHVPKLRFSDFSGEWKIDRIDKYIKRINDPVVVDNTKEYKQIGVRSHGKGIFHKDPVTGADLGNKRVFWIHTKAFIVNIVFAWEQAVALTSEEEKGFIASHRFPMFVPLENKADIDFVLMFFLRPKGKHLLGLASPGGAGRNKTLGQAEFAKLKVIFPDIAEQQKIAKCIKAVDTKTSKLRKKLNLLQSYKLSVMQKIFSQEVCFKKDDGTSFPDWESKKLNELLFEPKKRNHDLRFGKEDVLSVSGNFGVVNQIQHLGRSYAGASVANYHVVENGDIVYTKSPLKLNPYGIIKANKGEAGIVSTLYAVYSCKETANSEYLDYYFSLDGNLNKYLRPLVQKGAKNDMKINNQRVLIDPIICPSKPEQEKIVKFLKSLDVKINAASKQLTEVESFKRGLLQQMFV